MEESDLNSLVEDNINIALFALKKIRLPDSAKRNIEDYKSIALMAVVRASRSFDPEKGKFSTYAYKYVRQAITSEIRNSFRKKRSELSVSNNWNFDNSPPSYKHDFHSVDYSRLEDLMDCLSDRHKLFLRKHYGIGCKSETLRDIAKQNGLSASRVQGIVSKSLEKMKKFAQSNGYKLEDGHIFRS